MSNDKFKILDLSAGNRAIWFNKKHPDCIYLDKRPEVEPNFVLDTNELTNYIPFDSGIIFDLIVWDPPHMNCGPNSNMSKSYGYHTTEEILDTVMKTSHQARIVSRSGTLMAFKWNTHDIKLQRVLDLMPDWEPLFGHLTKNSRSQTYWVMLRAR